MRYSYKKEVHKEHPRERTDEIGLAILLCYCCYHSCTQDGIPSFPCCQEPWGYENNSPGTEWGEAVSSVPAFAYRLRTGRQNRFGFGNIISRNTKHLRRSGGVLYHARGLGQKPLLPTVPAVSSAVIPVVIGVRVRVTLQMQIRIYICITRTLSISVRQVSIQGALAYPNGHHVV